MRLIVKLILSALVGCGLLLFYIYSIGAPFGNFELAVGLLVVMLSSGATFFVLDGIFDD